MRVVVVLVYCVVGSDGNDGIGYRGSPYNGLLGRILKAWTAFKLRPRSSKLCTKLTPLKRPSWFIARLFSGIGFSLIQNNESFRRQRLIF